MWIGASAAFSRQSIVTPASAATPSASACALRQSIRPPNPAGSRARIRFSSSESGGASMNS